MGGLVIKQAIESMPFTFLLLPPELRLLVKDAIPTSDLRTHVCLYLSSPLCASLYDIRSDEDAFWKLACWEAGIGLLKDEDPETVVWRDSAIECIEKDGFYSHPECGGKLLEYNRAL